MENRVLEQQVCLVTGGSRGIGKAIVERFAENGAIVYANAREPGSIDGWCKEYADKYNTPVIPLYFDICDFSAARQAVMQIKKEQGRIDVLVNNAGRVSYEFLGMIDMTKVREMFEVNVIALLQLTQLTARLMTRQKYGSIINMASVVGKSGAKGQVAYSASKGAVIALTKSAAKELAEYHVRVNAVAPGMVATDRLLKIMEEKFKDKAGDIRMKRLALPSEIADACIFLASNRSEYITGQVIAVDGSLML